MIIISRTDGHLQIVDRTGKTIKEVATGGEASLDFIPYVAWSHATNAIAVAQSGQPLKFLDSENNWELRPVDEIPLANFYQAPEWSPDGQLLSVAFGSADGHLWFDATGKRLGLRPSCSTSWRPDGQRYVSTDSIHNRDGSLMRRRSQQGMVTWSGWHPRGHLFAVGTQESRFAVWHESDFQPYWHGVLLPDNKSATFSAAGELIDGKPEEIDQYLVYYIDRGDGRIETLTPAEFRKLLPGE